MRHLPPCSSFFILRTTCCPPFPRQVCANSNNDLQSLTSAFLTDLCEPFPPSVTKEVYALFHILQPTHLLPTFVPTSSSSYPDGESSTLLSHTYALLLDAHDQQKWCIMFRTIHSTMADFDGRAVLPYPLSLRYSSSSGATSLLYLNTHEFDRG